MEKPVLFDVENNVAVITFNRPDRRNSFNQEFLKHFYDYLEEVANNDDISVVIVTGNGKSFCSGIDLATIQTDNLFNPRGDGKDFPDIIGACKKPVIGAINGHAITGGFEIALNCDFLIASERASFADTHAKVGIHPGWGMTQLLQQAVGQRMAKQMSFTCQFISAEEAHRLGLVNEVVPHEELLTRAKEIAQQICETNQNILQQVKDMIEIRNINTHNESFSKEREAFRVFVEKHLKK